MKSNNPLFSALQAAGMDLIGSLMVGMPGRIVAYDSKRQRAQVECGIQRRLSDGTHQTLPVLINVPVRFSGSANWSVFHELPEGTEGYIHFSQRSTDAWLDMGGPAQPVGPEMFSASDAFFSPGYRSSKTVIGSLPTSGAGISNAGGTVKVHLTDDGVTMTVGGQTLALTSEGLTHNGTNIGSDHAHGGVESGGSSTGGPQ